jgi:hypothetical protein
MRYCCSICKTEHAFLLDGGVCSSCFKTKAPSVTAAKRGLRKRSPQKRNGDARTRYENGVYIVMVGDRFLCGTSGNKRLDKFRYARAFRHKSFALLSIKKSGVGVAMKRFETEEETLRRYNENVR